MDNFPFFISLYHMKIARSTAVLARTAAIRHHPRNSSIVRRRQTANKKNLHAGCVTLIAVLDVTHSA
jgi:hypothetical protein